MPINAGTVYVDVKPDTSAMTGKSGGLSTAMKTAGVLAAGAFAVSFARGAIAEAKEAEKAGLAFADSLSRGTENFKVDALSAKFDKINNALNVSDEELQTWASHFNNAIDFTSFGKKSDEMLTKMTALVPNLAAASGKSTSMVEKTIKTIGTAPEASVAALRKLGAITDEQALQAEKMLKHGKTAEAQQFLVANAYKATKGAAEAQQTASEKLSLQWAELQETVGTKLLPVLNQLMEWGMKFVTWVTSGSKESKVFIAVVGALVAGLAALKLATIAASVASNTAMVAQKAWSAMTKVATAAQWLWNAAMSANPLGLIVAAIVALIALVVVLWKKNETFRRIVLAVWESVKKAVVAVWEGIKKAAMVVFGALKSYVMAYFNFYKAIFSAVWQVAQSVFDKVKGIVKGAWDAIKSIFNGAKTVMGSVWDTYLSAAKTVFNAIATAWNSTVGKLSFSAPDWVPGIGGKGWDVPDIPMLAEGGIVTKPTLAVVGEAGPEAVVPLSGAGAAGGGMTVRIVDSNLGLVMDGVIETDKRYMDSRGRMGR